MTDWNDRRSEPRIPMDPSRLRVLDSETLQPIGILANLSGSGMMLHTQTAFTQSSSHAIALCWRSDQGEEKQIALGIHILWCSNGQSSDYWVGCEIIDIDEPSRSLLERLLQEDLRS